MRTRPNGYELGYEPPRTTGGLLLYLGALGAVPLAMSYPVTVAIGIAVTGPLVWVGLRVAREIAARTSDNERSTDDVLRGNHDRSPPDG